MFLLFLLSTTLTSCLKAEDLTSLASSSITSDEPVTAQVTQLIVIDGNNSKISPNSARNITVRALNSNGTPLSNVGITFSLLPLSYGNLSSATATTNASGDAQITFSSLAFTGQATILASSSAGSCTASITIESTSGGGGGGGGGGTTIPGVGTASKLLMNSVTPFTDADTCSDPIVITASDLLGGPVNVGSNTTIKLSKSGNGAFYSSSSCSSGTLITTTQIAAGTPATTVYFKSTKAQSQTLFASVTAGTTLDGASFPFTIQPGAFNAVALSGPTSIGNGVCSPAFNVTLQDANGNNITPAINIPVNLSVTGSHGGQFFTDSQCQSTTTAVTVAANTSSQIFYYKEAYAAGGTLNFSATGGGFTGTLNGVSLNAVGGPTKLTMGSISPYMLSTATCSSAIYITTTDALGNPVPVSALTSITLANSGNGGFYSDNTCGTSITTTSITANSSFATVYFKSTISETQNLMATATGLQGTSFPFTIQAGTVNKLTISGPAAIAGNACSPAFTVSLLDTNDNPIIVKTNTSVALSTTVSSGKFYSDSQCQSAVTSLTIAANSSSKIFYYKDTVTSGTAPTLTAVASGKTGTFNLSVTANGLPNKLVMNTFAPFMTAGACSSAITITSTDASGNPVPVSANTDVNLDKSGSGSFYTNSNCSSSAGTPPKVTIPSGSSSVTVYFNTTAAQSENLFATSTGFSGATLPFTIQADVFNALVLTGPASISNGQCSPAYVITRQDSQGNPVPTTALSTVTLSTTTHGNFYSDSNCATQVASVIIPANASSQIFYLKNSYSLGETMSFSATDGAKTASSNPVVAASNAPVRITISPANPIIKAGACSGAITIKTTDAIGNALDVQTNTTINLSNSGDGSFYLGSSCSNPAVTTASITSGNSAVTVSFKSNIAQSATLFATATNLNSGNSGLTIQPDIIQSFVVSGPEILANNTCSPVFTYTLVDAFGNSTTSNTSTSATLSQTLAGGASGSGKFYSDSQCQSQITAAISIPANTSSKNFYFKDAVSESLSLKATSGLIQGSTSVSVNAAGAPSRLVLSANKLYESAGVCTALTITSTDTLGNPLNVASATTVAVTSSSGLGLFYSGSNCGGGGTSSISTTISAGASSVTVSYKSTSAQSLIFYAADSTATPSLNASSLAYSIIAGSASSVAMSGPTIIGNNACSPAYAVSLKDGNGNTIIPTSDTAITLSGKGSNGADFYSDSACKVSISSATISANTNSQVFYIKGPYAAGETLTVGASNGALTAASLSVQVAAAGAPTRLVMTSVIPYMTAGASCSGAITITSTDNLGNPVNVTGSNKTITLAKSGSGVFYSDNTCATSTATATINANSNFATIYFKSNVAENQTLFGTSGTMISASMPFTVQGGVLDSIAISGPTVLANNTCSSAYQAILLDAQLNKLSPDTATSLTLSTNSAGTFYEDSNCQKSISTLSVPARSSSAVFYFKNATAQVSKTMSATVTASTPTGSLTFTTNASGAPTKLALSSVPPYATAGTCQAITITSTDNLGNPLAVSASTTVNLAQSGSGTYYSASGCGVGTSITSTSIASGSSATVYYKSSVSGNVTLVASDGNATPSMNAGTMNYSVLSSAASKLVIFTGETAPASGVTSTIIANSTCSPAFGIAVQDASNNYATGSTTTVALASNKATAKFYSDSQCLNQVTQVVVPSSGLSTQSFYIKDTASTAEAVTVTSSSGSLTNGTFTVNVNAPSGVITSATKLAISPLNASVIAGACSSKITLYSTDSLGTPVNVTSTTTVNLGASGAGSFFPSASCTPGAEITSIDITNGANSADVYFSSTIAQSLNLVATSSSLNAGSFPYTVKASTLDSISITGPNVISYNVCSAAFTVSRQDQYGNTLTSTSSQTVTLTGNGSNGTFYSDSTCTTSTSSAVIAANRSSGTFYFKDSNAAGETLTLTGTNGGKTGTIGISVVATGAPMRLVMNSTSSTVTAGGCSDPISITSNDSAYNAVNVSADTTVDLNSNSNGTFHASTDTTCATPIAAKQITITNGTSSKSFRFKPSASGTISLYANTSGLIRGIYDVYVPAGSITSIAITGPATIGNSVCSPAYSVSMFDSQGNKISASSSTTVTLAQALVGGGTGHASFFTDSACLNSAAGSITIAKNETSALFYLKNSQLAGENVRLTATSGISGTYDVTVAPAGAPTQLVVNSIKPYETAGTCSQVITVTSTDVLGNPLPINNSGASTINLSLNDNGAGSFYASTDATCTGSTISTVDIAAAATSASFKFKSSTASNSLKIYSRFGTLNAGSMNYTVQPSTPSALVLSGNTNINTSQCSTFIATLSDTNGNVTSNLSSAVTVNLSGNGSGTFYSNATCTTALTSSNLTIAQYKTSNTFYFKDASSENLTFTAASTTPSALTSGTLGVAVTASSGGGGSSNQLLAVQGNNTSVAVNGTKVLKVIAVNGTTGAPVGSIPVNFSIVQSGVGTLTAATDTTNGTTGIATTTFNAGTTIGPVTILATSTAGSVALNVNVGPSGIGSQIIKTQGDGVAITTSATQTLQVLVLDADSNPVASNAVTFSIVSGSGSLTGGTATASTTTSASGYASTVYTAATTTGTATVLASVSGIGSASFALTIGSSATAPSITFSPTSLTNSSPWDAVLVGASANRTVTLLNNSTSTIYINSIASAPSQFTVNSSTCFTGSRTSISASSTCTITFKFSPTDGTTVNGFGYVNWSTSSDGSNPQIKAIDLTATGPTAITFGGITSATAISPTSITVNWSAPASTTGLQQYSIYTLDGSGVRVALKGIATPPSTSFTITGLTPNTAYKLGVFAMNTANALDSNTASQTVTTPAGVALTALTDSLLTSHGGSGGWLAGINKTIDINNSITGDDTGMTYTCKVGRTATGSASGKSTCGPTNLIGIYTPFGTSTGIFSWTPSYGAEGFYEFEFTGTLSGGTTVTSYLKVNVVNPLLGMDGSSSNLIADYRGPFSNGTGNTTTGTTWYDVFTYGWDPTISGTGTWAGSASNSVSKWNGSVSTPNVLQFTSNTKLGFSSTMMNNASADSAMLNLWMSNTDASFSSGRIIAKKSTSGGTNGGITLSQWSPVEVGATSLKQVKFSHDISYPETIKADNPFAYYRMDAASGTTLTDEKGSNICGSGTGSCNATLNAASDWSYGETGTLIHESTNTAMRTTATTGKITLPTFTGTDYFMFTSSASVPSGTLEFWMKLPSSGFAAQTYPFAYSATAGSNGYAVRIESTNKISIVGDTTSLEGTYTFGTGQYIDNQWHHWVITFDYISGQTVRKTYVDGMLITTGTGGGYKAYGSPTTIRGFNTTSGAANISIDEVAFYKTALTASQIESHFGAGIRSQFRQSQFPANPTMQLKPVGFWRLGDSTTTAWDSSGYGNHGAYSGNLFRISGSYSANNNTYRYSNNANYASGNDATDGAYQPGVAATPVPAATPSATPNPSTTGGDFVKVPYSDSLKFSTVMSVAGWVFIPPGAASSTNEIIGQTGVWAVHWVYSSGTPSFYLKFCTGGTSSSCTNFMTSGTTSNSFFSSYNGKWMHFAVVYNGSGATDFDQVKLFMNGQEYYPANGGGSINSDLSSFYTTTTELRIGGGLSGQTGIQRHAMDDFSVYNKALSASQVQALYTDSSFRYCTTDISSSSGSTLYDNISVLFDKLLNMTFLNKNGKQECAIKSTGISMANDTSTFQIGDSTNSFVGNLYSAQVYSSDSTSHVATSYNQVNNFAVSADQLRPQQVGLLQNTWNTSTNSPNLILDYEASVSRDGMRSWDSGSISTTSTPQVWRDNAINQIAGTSSGDITLKNLTTNAYPGALVNFTNSNYTWSAYGSVGSLGQSAYYLGFLGSSNMYIDAGNVTALDSLSKMTVCTWMYGVGNATNAAIVAKGTSSSNSFFLGYDSTSASKLTFNINGNIAKAITSNTISDSTWYYVCGVYDGSLTYSATTPNVKIYAITNNPTISLSGTSGYYASSFTSAISSTTNDLTVGSAVTQGRAAVSNSFTGGIGAVQIYNTALTSGQIYNNCVAQAANYTTTAPTTFCTIP